jgi:Tol biopolymer transport system component
MLPPTLSADDVRAHLQRVLSSASFAGSGRASTLLAFLVDESLAGRTDRLKEYTLGVEALGKGDSFDPRIDPIVRTEMSRLRTRLERYYAAEGETEDVVIVLRKGSYVPEFAGRTMSASARPSTVDDGWRYRRGRQLVWLGVGAAVGAIGFVVALRWRQDARSSPLAPEVRLAINTPPTYDVTSLAISPDGRQVVYAANADGRSELWLRPMDAESARPLAGTEGAKYPFWSPDGRAIGFISGIDVKTVDLDGGSPHLVVRGVTAFGGAWSPNDVIVFNTTPGSSLWQIPAPGGDRSRATMAAPGAPHRAPHFLPDGRHILHLALGQNSGMYVSTIGGNDSRRLVDADAAIYHPATGRLLFVRDGTLFAQPFDLSTLRLSGAPGIVAHQVASVPGGPAAFSSSSTGAFIYRSGRFDVQRELRWVDRSGHELSRVPNSNWRGGIAMSLSPDGKRVAFDEDHAGATDIWTLELERGVRTRLTSDPAFEMQPIWSPDGRRIVFQSNRNGRFDLRIKSTLSDEQDQKLLDNRGRPLIPYDWSSDGRFILYGETGKWSLWALPMKGDPKPISVVSEPPQGGGFAAVGAQFSADGRWVAYTSNVDAKDSSEIYIQRFPNTDRRWKLSTAGGIQPRWRRDGRELFFLTLESRLMAVPLRLGATDDAVDIGKPSELFRAPLAGIPTEITSRSFDVSPDGQRFLLDSMVEVMAPITVVLNWKPRQ